MPRIQRAMTPPRSGVLCVARVEPATKIVVVGAVVGACGGAVLAVVAGARVVEGADVELDRGGAVDDGVVLLVAGAVVSELGTGWVVGEVVDVGSDGGVGTGSEVVVSWPAGAAGVAGVAAAPPVAVRTPETASTPPATTAAARRRGGGLRDSPGTSRCPPRTTPRA